MTSSTTEPVVVFLAFANDRVDPDRHLRSLADEQRQVRAALEAAEQAGHCEIVERANATITEILDVFQNVEYRNRIAIFHFGGHAGDGELFLESPEGEARVAHAAGLARFLGEQRGLELVFLNGCSSRGQARGLLDAGVSAVLATSVEIDDARATEFSVRFYKSLASGQPIRTGYREAAAAVETRHGESTRDETRGRDALDESDTPSHGLPWDLYHLPGADERLGRWSLPAAARDPLFGLPPLPERDLPARPFKHLEWFTADDAEVFFGRGHQIRRLYEAVTLPDAAPIVLLFGASGVGKSSLLAAGLLPRLESGHAVEYVRRDGSLGLAGALARVLGGNEDFGRAWRRREEELEKPLVVILDQVEEAWTRPLPGGGEGAELAAALRRIFAVRDERPRGRLILTFRKEWLAEVLGLVESARLPRPRRIELRHLDRDGIMEAVAGAARTARLERAYGLRVDLELPGIVADDLLADAGAAIAPALQILLTKMWTRATETDSAAPEFSVELYRDLRRQGILLDDYLDEQLAGLRQWRADTVRSGLALDLLAHHTTPLGTAEVRQAAEVVERYGDRRDVIELLQEAKDRYLLGGTFRAQDGRLLPLDHTQGPEAEPDLGTSRLAHDTLAPLIRRLFRSSDLPGQRALRVLEQRAVEWADGKEGPPLDDVDLAIVDEGERGMRARDADQERLVAASRRRREHRRRTRRAWQWTGAVMVAALLAVGGTAWVQWRQAEATARVATAAKLAATGISKLEGQHEHGLLLSAQAVQLAGTFEPRDALLRALQAQPRLRTHLRGHEAPLTSVAFAPDGKTLASADWDGTIRLWNAVTHQPLGSALTGHEDEVNDIDFSPDGRTLASAGEDGTVRLWDVANGVQIGAPMVDEGPFGPRPVSAVDFAPDGKTLASGGVSGQVHFWRVSRREPLRDPWRWTDSTRRIRSLDFSHDGAKLALAGDGVQVWDVESERALGDVWEPNLLFNEVRFAAGGEILAAAGEDGRVRLWSVANRQLLFAPWTADSKGAFAVAPAPDGETLVSAGEEGVVRFWSVASAEPLEDRLSGHESWVTDLAFSPDGDTLASASHDGTVRLWNVAVGNPLSELLIDADESGQFRRFALSPDGETCASAGADGTVQLWSWTTRQPVGAPLAQERGRVLELVFTSDGRTLILAGHSGTLRRWDVASREPLGEPWTSPNGWDEVAISSDGRTLATVGKDGVVQVCNIATGEPTCSPLSLGESAAFKLAVTPDGRTLFAAAPRGLYECDLANERPCENLGELGYNVGKMAFGREGKVLALTGQDGPVRLWDVEAARPLGEPLLGHEGSVFGVDFVPEHALASLDASDSDDPAFRRPLELLASTGLVDGTVRLWDPATGQPLGQPLTTMGSKGLGRATFSPDGRSLVSVGSGGVRRWDMAVDSWVRRACERANRNLSLAEWEQYVGPEIPYECTCPDLPPGDGVDSCG